MDALSHILATTGGRGSQFSNAGMEVLSAIVHFLGECRAPPRLRSARALCRAPDAHPGPRWLMRCI